MMPARGSARREAARRPRRRVRLFNVHRSEAEGVAGQLTRAGYRVEQGALSRPSLERLRSDPPDAVVIDLSRAPAVGRDLAIWLRRDRWTRRVPIVLVGGAAPALAAVERLLPDAVFSSWRGVRGALARAIAHPPRDPVVPSSVFAAYAGRPLVKKLGIRAGARVALIGAPASFERTLADLPPGVTVVRRPEPGCDLIVWFVKSRQALARRIRRLGQLSGSGGLWIAWPKRGSGIPSDLSQIVVRRTGLDNALVDYKVCAIDATWSGLRFARRRSVRGRTRHRAARDPGA